MNKKTENFLFRTKMYFIWTKINVFYLNKNKFILLNKNKKKLIKYLFNSNKSANKHLLCG